MAVPAINTSDQAAHICCVFAYPNLEFDPWKLYDLVYCGQNNSFLAGAAGGKPTTEFRGSWRNNTTQFAQFSSVVRVSSIGSLNLRFA